MKFILIVLFGLSLPSFSINKSSNPFQSICENFDSNSPGKWNLSRFQLTNAIGAHHLPFEDHTSHSKEGGFVMIQSSSYEMFNWGSLKAKNPFIVQQATKICFGFAYLLYGEQNSSIRLNIISTDDKKTTVYHSYDEIAIKWHEALVDITIDENTAMFEIYTNVLQGTVAIDDIEVTMGECTQKNECDFESESACMFKPVSNQLPSWKIFEGYDVNIKDHTTDTGLGHFYGINVIHHNTNTITSMITTKTTFKDDLCFRFSYYIMGNGNISLYYQAFDENHLIIEKDSWKITGANNLNGQVGWLTHQATIFSPVEGYFSIQMGVVIPPNHMDNQNIGIFVDDIQIMSGICKSNECDFESDDACSLEILRKKSGSKILSDEDKIVLAKISNLTLVTYSYLTNFIDSEWHVYTPLMNGQSIDHDNTIGTSEGRYLLFVSHHKVERGIILTDRYDIYDNKDENYCLSLAVVKPTDNSYIEIYQAESMSPSAKKLYGTNIKITDWRTLQIQTRKMKASSKDMYFFIIATAAKSDDTEQFSYVAIDDYSFERKECDNPDNPLPYPTTITTTTSPISTTPLHGFHDGRFYCDPDMFISVEKVCDHHIDCQNHLDELECGTCHIMPGNICGYDMVAENVLFLWRLTKDSYHGPKDHLEDSLTAFGDLTKAYENYAKLISPLIHESFTSCHYSFFYLFNSNWNDTNDRFYLEMQIQDEDPVTLWQSGMSPSTAYKKNEWQMIDFFLGRIPHPFRLILKATPLGPEMKIDTYSESYHSVHSFEMKNCDPPKPIKSDETCHRFLCENNVCIDKENVCDFEDDCGDGSDENEQNCDYTNQMSSFQKDSDWGRWGDIYRINWRIEDVESFQNYRHGPGYDHTLRYSSGGRILFTGTDNYEPKMAIVDGPPIQISKKCIIRMFVLKNTVNSTLFLKLWDLETNEIYLLNTLREERLYYDRFYYMFPEGRWNGTYKILIEAELRPYKNNFLKPYIAIDDISFSNDCHILSTEPRNLTTIAPDDFCDGMWCENEKQKRICIPESEICDFVPQCHDGSDEAQCGDCNFNQGTSCRWENQVEADGYNGHWNLIEVASNAPDPLPNRDGQNNPMGGYMGFIFDFHEIQTEFQSPFINAHTNEHCKLTFQLISSLEEIFEIFLNDHFIHSIYTQTRNEWKDYVINIGQRSFNFNIIIGIRSFRSQNDKRKSKEFIAIDTIQLHNCTGSKNDSKPESIEKLNCDFETGLCGWIIANDDDDDNQQQSLSWFRTNRPDIEPGEDHTSRIRPLPKKHGIWLTDSIKLADNIPRRTSILKTASKIKVKNANVADIYCFSFWYYFFGIESGLLSVIFRQSNENFKISRMLWQRIRPTVRNWQQAWIEVNSLNEDFDLLIKSELNANTISGIDDIWITRGKCPLPSKEFCDFEINECDWKQLAGHLQRRHNGQNNDHTTGTTTGHYLAQPTMGDSNLMISSVIKSLESLPFYPENDTAVLNPLRRYEFCLNLYYYFLTLSELNLLTMDMEQQSTAKDVKLSIQIQENNYRSTLKNVSLDEIISINQQNKWTLMSVSFTATKQASIIMQIQQSMDQDTMILIDDVRFIPHFCDSLHGNCDFETDMCGWYNGIDMNQNTNDNQLIYWIRVQPKNHFVSKSGCSFDHTLGRPDGNYLALVLDMYRQSSSTVETILRGPIINRPKNQDIACFRMFYFANCEDQNTTIPMTLRVLDLHKNGAISHQFDVYAQTHEPIGWIEFAREFHHLPMVYSFEIVTKYNSKITSDLGIDDIKIEMDRCWKNSDSSPMIITTPLPDSERISDCDFEQDCHWKFDPKIWTITSHVQRNDQYAPPIDHTLKESAGHYIMFINDTNHLDETNQYLVGPPMNYDRERCLSFWYYADGGSPFDVFRLDLSYSHGHINNLGKNWINQFSKFRFLRTQSWRQHRVTIPFTETNEIHEKILIRMNFSLSSDISSSKTAFISFAIDDIQMQPGRCQHQNDYSYTFTNGLDGLMLEQIQPLSEIDTFFINYPTIKAHDETDKFPLNIPHADHTTYSITDGYYIGFMNKKIKTILTDYIDRLSIENVPADVSQRSCVRFAYQLAGNVSLKVYWSVGDYFDDENDRHNDHLLWAINSEKLWWTVVEFDKQLDFKHRIVFEIIKPTSDRSYLAMDDLIVLNRPCQRPIDCDFNQDDYCSYTDYNTQSGQAFRVYATWTSDFHPDFPGPRLDHSQIEGNGFLMLSAWRWSPDSSTDTKEKPAQIISGAQPIERGRIYCLEMWAWINDPKAYIQIELLRYSLGHYANSFSLGRIQEVQHDRWTPYYFTIDREMLEGEVDEIQILIEGIIITNPKTMIALDDISLHQDRCKNESIKCLNGKVIMPEQQCDFRKDCPSGWDEIGCGEECNFEKDDCGWKDTGFRDKDHWFRTSVPEMQAWSPSLAPKFDADGNIKGHYIMMRRWIGGQNSQSGHAEMALNARKISLYFKHSSVNCLVEFDYFAQASSAFFLKVRFGDDIDDMNTFYIIAHTNGSTHGSWTHAYSFIGQQWTPFIVEFEAFDQSTQSVIALDNIRFIDCAFEKPLSPGENCYGNQVLCNQTRICIRPDSICDGIDDCGGDGEDESVKHCDPSLWRRCSFESWSQCRLTLDNHNENHAHWQIVTGAKFEDNRLNPGYEPLIDNSRRSRSSPYALLIPGSSKDQNSPQYRYRYASIYTTWLSSEVLNITKPCQIRFFYYWHTDVGRIIDANDLSLEVFVHYQDDDNDVSSDQSKILWSVTATDVLDQQRWYKAVVEYPDPNDNDWIDHWNNNHLHNLTMKPFQFVLRGWIHEDEHSRLAIDDLSYGFNCIAIDSNRPTTTSSTNQPTGSTDRPIIHHHNKSKATGIFVVVIFISVIIIVIVVFARRQYYNRNNNDLTRQLTVSLKHLNESNPIEDADEAIEQHSEPSASSPPAMLINDDDNQQNLDEKTASITNLPSPFM
ncbi:hypothetical protein DERP_005006 [Dermatophagoides pteronyssinus]|uniref:MAM domain-containing protein n=1 Tax=Dermatophagoides pteronyssinus TaxID=6956 RepID=A0ABQ8JT39_DERPT|nr:hypothetical protein DERP_005006 [Dermatophagoides pteronyssinus]